MRFNSGMKTLLDSFSQLNPWVYLFTAGFFEIAFTTFMKLSDGFKNWTFNICFAVCAILSFGLLNLSTQKISLGTAYAVWTGMGAFGTVVVGMVFFKDPVNVWRVAFLTTLIGSIIGVKFVSAT